MKIETDKALYEAKWFDFGEETRLQIRPYPLSRTDFAMKDGAVVLSGEGNYDMFEYCLVGWEGILDQNDKPVKLTAEIKKMVYDFRLGKQSINGTEFSISEFVLRTARSITAGIEADSKN